MPHDPPLDAPVMTRRVALERAHNALLPVVTYCLDLGLTLDEMDHAKIREAFEMVNLARKEAP